MQAVTIEMTRRDGAPDLDILAELDRLRPRGDVADPRLFNRLAKHISANLDREQFAPRTVMEGGLRGHVAAIGELDKGAAEFLAHGLGRTLHVFDSLDRAIVWIDRDPPDSVLFLGSSQVPARVAASKLQVAHGFICADCQEDLWYAVLRLAAFHRLRSRSETDLMLLPPSKTQCIDVIDGTTWVIGQVAGLDFERLIGSPKRIFGLLTHSDGLSTFLGPVNFCVSDSMHAMLRPGIEPGPTCMTDGYCYRFQMTMEAAREASLLFAPERLRSDVFLNLSCWGSHFGSVIHPSLSLSFGFNKSMSTRAQITSTSVLSVDTALLDLALAELQNGATLGACVMALNRASLPRGTAEPDAFLLYGDPAYRPVDMSDSEADRLGDRGCLPLTRATKAALAEVTPVEAKTSFLREYIANVAARRGRYEIASAAPLELEFEELLRTGRLEDRVLDMLGEQARLAGSIIMHDWLPFSSVTQTDVETFKCVLCGHVVTRQIYSTTLGLNRQVDICQSCGVLHDGPAGSRMMLMVSDRAPTREGEVEITLSVGVGPARALIAIETPRAEHAVSSEVIISDEGRVRRRWKAPSDFPIGAAVVSGFSFFQGCLAVCRVPIACRTAGNYGREP